MKYMGSKRAMLKNGLGELIEKEIANRSRFVDLFCGSAAVSWHVAERYAAEVVAVDIQRYSSALASAILCRNRPSSPSDIWNDWFQEAKKFVTEMNPPMISEITIKSVEAARYWCKDQPIGTLIYAYGGHYFSPLQATWIEGFRRNLPESSERNSIALAALISASSQAAAAPGHTAQPFQPTKTAKKFISSAWSKDIPSLVSRSIEMVAPRHSKLIGKTACADANKFASTLNPRDLVFIDPPYSDVQYSRFYHVLESIADGTSGIVSGKGRYPSQECRPRSSYSTKSGSKESIEELLMILAEKRADAILTFPDHQCSNGLSGQYIESFASRYFNVQRKSVASTFSTLGGVSNSTEGTRSARQAANELILLLKSD